MDSLQWMAAAADDSPLLGCLYELDFPAIDFLSRQFLKGIFQVAVRGKLNNPAKPRGNSIIIIWNLSYASFQELDIELTDMKSYPSLSLGRCASANVTSPACLMKSFRSYTHKHQSVDGGARDTSTGWDNLQDWFTQKERWLESLDRTTQATADKEGESKNLRDKVPSAKSKQTNLMKNKKNNL